MNQLSRRGFVTRTLKSSIAALAAIAANGAQLSSKPKLPVASNPVRTWEVKELDCQGYREIVFDNSSDLITYVETAKQRHDKWINANGRCIRVPDHGGQWDPTELRRLTESDVVVVADCLRGG